jgi:HAD superfamily hydrolase (TIGR01509 family)
MIKAVIFDLDGVLIDSASLVVKTRREVLAAHGVNIDEVPDPHQQGHMGSSTKNILAAVKEHLNITVDEKEYSDSFTEKIRKGLVDSGITADPELLILLTDLKEQGIICAIATASRSGSMQVKMDILDVQRFFKTIVTADDVAAHKPAPDLYLEAIKRLGLQPSECVVVEDSSAGIASGVAAGCKVIGVTKYSSDKSELPGTLITINSWNEISADHIFNIS